MDFKELHQKYQALLIENDCLKEEIRILNVKLGAEELQDALADVSIHNPEQEVLELEQQNEISKAY